MDWMNLATGTEKWQALMDMVITFIGSITCGECLDYPREHQLLKKPLEINF